MDKQGGPAAGFAVEDDGGEIESCNASPAADGPNIVRCGSTADGADVCWIGTDERILYCGTTPWEKKLRKYYRAQPGDPVAARGGDPWGLVLADGTRCQIRNGGAWPGRADDWVGAYSCTNEERAVLVRGGMTSAVDRSQPQWTVYVGQLSADNAAFPPPTKVAVTTAYLAVAP